MRPIVYSIVCSSAIGYVFGVIFAVRAIQMSQLTGDLRDMIVVTGWMGLTFAVMFVPPGVTALGLVQLLSRLINRHLSRRTRIYLLTWLILTTAISIPFLGYYYSSGVNPHDVAGSGSAWDLIPRWLLRVGRWLGFSALTGSVLAFVVEEAVVFFFGVRKSDRAKLKDVRLAVGVPLIILTTWLVPPLWLSASSPEPAPEPVAERVEVEVPLSPVVVVGWDGATWDVIDPLLEAGRLPVLASLIDHGVRAPLRSFVPTSSPLLWTTISTGRSPLEHGVRSQVENRFRGMRHWFFFPSRMGFDHVFGRIWERLGIIDRVQITSHARKRQAFWNILSDEGRRVGLVNWRVGWPAETIEGFNITDHVYPYLEQVMDEEGGLPPAMTDAELLERMPGALEPAVRMETLEACLEAAGAEALRLSRQSELPLDLAPLHEVFAMELGYRFLEGYDPDVLGIYLYDLDAIEHRYWKYREPKFFFGVSEEDQRRLGGAIDRIHVFYDLMLGRILEAVGSEATVILLSDHGHVPVFGELQRSGGHASAPPGILVMSGGAVDPSATLGEASVYDIFPTLMYLSGLPVEREARGRVLLEALKSEVRVPRPVRFIESYPLRQFEEEEARRTSPLDQEMIQRLRALGYVG